MGCGSAHVKLTEPSATTQTSSLLELLTEARELGLLGPGPVDQHVRHAQQYVEATAPPTKALDLGSGAGVPGLALAIEWRKSSWTLLDSSTRRTAFLAQAVGRLGLKGRVRTVCARAEDLGRSEERQNYDLVTARSFGAPAVTAECGAGLLALNGRLLVSEPPERSDRWPSAGLALLGLRLESGAGAAIAVMSSVGGLSTAYPRRAGIPGKRPLF